MIDRPVEEVWNFINDWSNAPKWNTWRGTRGLIEAKVTSEGQSGVGTIIQSRWSTRPNLATSRITEYQPGRKLTLEVTSPGMIKGTTESLDLENIEGRTKFNSAWELKFNGFFGLLGPFQVGRFRGFNEARISNLKRMLESGSKS